MPGGSIGKVISGATMNELREIPSRIDNQENKPRTGGAKKLDPNSTEIVRVKNATGEDLPRFAPIVLDDLLHPPEESALANAKIDAIGSLSFSGVQRTAANALRKFGILEEPISAGKIGRVRIGGIGTVKVEPPSSGYLRTESMFVAPSIEDPGKWKLADEWGFPVIWREQQPGTAESATSKAWEIETQKVEDPFFAMVSCSAVVPPNPDFAFVSVDYSSSKSISKTEKHLDPNGVFSVGSNSITINARGWFWFLCQVTYNPSGSSATDFVFSCAPESSERITDRISSFTSQAVSIPFGLSASSLTAQSSALVPILVNIGGTVGDLSAEYPVRLTWSGSNVTGGKLQIALVTNSARLDFDQVGDSTS